MRLLQLSSRACHSALICQVGLDTQSTLGIAFRKAKQGKQMSLLPILYADIVGEYLPTQQDMVGEYLLPLQPSDYGNLNLQP